MLEASKRKRGTVIALALFAAGVAGTIVDPNGPMGITLFGVAAAAVVYLTAVAYGNVRRVRGAARRPATIRRPMSTPRLRVVGVVRRRTVTVVAGAAGVLFTIWLTVDMSRPLVYATWWGFCLLAAWLIGVALLTARRSERSHSA
jgi:hypothetical protein